MRIIEIQSLPNGAHRNQSGCSVCPQGWAVIPDGMDTPNFPFGDVTVEGGVVTSWTAGTIPEPEPVPEPGPTEMEQLRADVDYIALMGGIEL